MPSWGPVLPDKFETVSAASLLDSVYQPKTYIVENMLSTGLYMLAGAPKVGKSFFVLQLAHHVAIGKELFGRKVTKGDVLYLALEDTLPRLQERSFKMFPDEAPEGLCYSVRCGSIYENLLNQLSGFAYEHPSAKLVIIDTLQKVRDNAGEQLSYASDYEVMSELKAFADVYQICILVVHHTRKQGSDDSFAMISGTNGLMGASDGAMVLRKEVRTSDTATLDITSRDAGDQRLHLKRDRKTLNWRLEREETELWKEPPDPLLEKINEMLSGGCRRWEGTATELAAMLNVKNARAMGRRLNVSAGKLKYDYGIDYTRSHTNSGSRITFERTGDKSDKSDNI